MSDDEFVERLRQMPHDLARQIEQFEKSRQAVMVACERVFFADCEDILGDIGQDVETASELKTW